MAEEMSRRTVLSLISAALAGLWSAAAATLAGAFVTTPLRRVKAQTEVPLGSASLAGEEYRRVEVEFPIKDGWHERSEYTTVFVRNAVDGTPYVLSGICSHLACTVNWDSEKQEFRCPCHAGRFAPDGSVISGPPPRGLTRLAAEKRGKSIFITLDV